MNFYQKLLHPFSAFNDKKKDLLNKLSQAAADLEKELLKQHSIHADSEKVRSFCSAFEKVLEEGLHPPSTPSNNKATQTCWNALSFNMDSYVFTFINDTKKTEPEEQKLLLWILIELSEKTLSNTFEKISGNPQILSFYGENSILEKNAFEVKEILDKIVQREYEITSTFLQSYEQAKPVTIPVGEIDQNSQMSTHEEEKERSPRVVIDEDQIKENIDRYRKLLEISENQKRQSERDSFIRDDYKKYLEERREKRPAEIIRKILGPRKLRRTRSTHKKRKTLRKTSSFDDLDAQKVASSGGIFKGLLSHLNLNRSKEEGEQPETIVKKLSVSTYRKSDESGSIIPENDHSFRSDPRNLDDSHHSFLSEEYSNYIGTRKDLRHMKRSEALFIQKYWMILQEYEYREPPKRMMKAEDQDYKCFGCGAEVNRLLLILWSKRQFCHYTGYWYCSDCISEEKLYIPWYVAERFDFKKYHVCKTARDELYKSYSKPNIAISHMSPVVQKNKEFYETLVMKRELHLIYDMICDSLLVSDLLRENMNLVLKVNLFSMKNLVEVQNGVLLKYIEKSIEILRQHMNGCSDCQSKGKICSLCNNKTRIFAFDIKNTSVCKICRTLYHARCLRLKHCIVCEHNF